MPVTTMAMMITEINGQSSHPSRNTDPRKRMRKNQKMVS
jgi:hypothetical protein